MSYVDEFKKIHDELVSVHDELVGTMMVSRGPVVERSVPVADLADIGFFLRELERHLDEMRKDVAARKDLIERLICLHSVKRMQEGENSGNVVGRFASATPDLGQTPVVPKLGTPEYDDLMREIGVPVGAYKDKLVVPHWKYVKLWIEERLASGLPVPKGVTTRPDYRAKFHRRKKTDG